MLHTRWFPLLGALLIGGCGLANPASAQQPGRESLSDVVLPCGVRAALDAMGDRSAPDRGHFVLETVRRLHQSPVSQHVQRTDALPALIAHLDRCAAAGGGVDTSDRIVETVPLPLPVSMWVDTVFGGRVNQRRLAAAILESRNASLLYLGLMSLDETTRDWIGGRPELISEIVTRHAPAFTLIAPGLRVTSAGVQAPGGERAEPVWQALVGRATKDPAEFVRALLASDERHLPYMFGALAQLSPAEAQLALNLDASDPNARIASARRLHEIYLRLARTWRAESRAFSRPLYDPALLAADLRHDAEGRPVLPGTRRFWTAVFEQDGRLPDNPRALAEASKDPVEFASLCEQVFEGDAGRHRRRYYQVLFGSRVLRNLNADQTQTQMQAAVEAVRAVDRYPALVAALERAGIVDVTVIAAATRRAARLTNIGNGIDAVRADAQFQGLLMLLQRATLRNSISVSAFADIVTTLAAVELADDDTYQGRLVRWLDQQLQQRALGGEDFEEQPIERTLLTLVAGASTQASTAPQLARASHVGEGKSAAPAAPAAARIVAWEGTRYRVDHVAAEAARLERLRGEQPRPYVSAARALIGVADALLDLADAGPRRGEAASPSRQKQKPVNKDPGLIRETLAREAQTFARVVQAVGWKDGNNWTEGQHWLGAATLDRARDAAALLDRAAKRADRAAAARLAPAILLLADDLLARGLTELVYATALGRPERAGFAAEEAAAHHDFKARVNGVRNDLGPWEHPVLSAGSTRESRVTGSLLGLDVALASFSLVRLSSKLPPRRPTLDENDRRALVESVALVGELGDADRDLIVDAIGKGRDRLATAKTPADAIAISNEIEMSRARRNLLIWTVTRTPDRLAAFLSPSELLWLGLGPTPIDARLNAWGAPAKPRVGCLCLELLDRRRPLEPLTGRWGSGIFVSTFPDLNLRIAELLAELRMPASLLGPILTSATLDLVNNTASRDPDDRRALVEFVAALTRDRVEQYLALLTTDGPLVPIGKAPETSISTITTGVP